GAALLPGLCLRLDDERARGSNPPSSAERRACAAQMARAWSAFEYSGVLRGVRCHAGPADVARCRAARLDLVDRRGVRTPALTAGGGWIIDAPSPAARRKRRDIHGHPHRVVTRMIRMQVVPG